MINNRAKLKKAIEKEIRSIGKAEANIQKASAGDNSKYKELLKSKISPKIPATLEKSFSRAFGFVFDKGITIIEKGYDKESISNDFDIQDYAVDLKCGRKELKRIKKAAKKSDFKNMSITAVEGIGLGALGVGLPDIVLFIGMVLKGIYEVALHYGYEYDSDSEKYLILKLMRASLSKSIDWEIENNKVDQILNYPPAVNAEMMKKQIDHTSKLFAMDMLVLKFVQGIPFIGTVGGAFNPVYYNKIMSYVRIKYYKRYLKDKLSKMEGDKIWERRYLTPTKCTHI